MKKRALLGPLFPILSKARHSRATRLAIALSRWPLNKQREYTNRPYYFMDISGTKGIGALLCEALVICRHAEHKHLLPIIISSNRLYCQPNQSDFLKDFFNQPLSKSIEAARRPTQVHTLWDLRLLSISENISLEDAHRVFTKYFIPAPQVTQQVADVLEEAQLTNFDLSIHYRGTDKHLEARTVAFSEVDTAVIEYLKTNQNTKNVFLATDELTFEVHFRAQFPELKVSTYFIDKNVDSTRGRHFSSISPEDKAKEAIVNMFLLARAPMCIRTSSYLSAMSRIINPALKTKTLSLTHWGSTAFPEMQIIAQE
jgi:hypothetical protein